MRLPRSIRSFQVTMQVLGLPDTSMMEMLYWKTSPVAAVSLCSEDSFSIVLRSASTLSVKEPLAGAVASWAEAVPTVPSKSRIICAPFTTTPHRLHGWDTRLHSNECDPESLRPLRERNNDLGIGRPRLPNRSEEHTSELQSPMYL